MKRLFLLAALLSAPLALSAADDPAKTRVEKSPRHLEWITVKRGDREVGCYVGYPEVKDKAPAVLVIHEIFGHSDWVRAYVDELAEAGYIAIAPDLLWGAGPKGGGTQELSSSEIGQKIRALPADQITADLAAALDYIIKQPSCNGKVVSAGFCWGGGQSFRFASNTDKLKAALVFYGAAPTPAEMARIKCPVYGFYAGNDARITAALPKAIEDMHAAGKVFETETYEGAGHGFMRAGDDPAGTEANKKARDSGFARLKVIMAKL